MKDRTTITFHSGLDTIGGVIMEVRYNDCRAFFEAGTAYNPAFDMFDGKVNLRRNFISDYLWTDEIPKIDGIYRKEDIAERYPDLISAEDYDIKDQAFYITHLHLDHMRLMGMISPLVRVHLSNPAKIIEKALEEVGQGVESIRGCSYTDIPDESWVGDIHVTRFILNDDSYQDYSFLIETPDLTLHHTGDVFVYGKYEQNILNEIKYLNEKNVDILVCEGTRFFSSADPQVKIDPCFDPPEGMITFDRLKERMTEMVSAYPGLVMFDYYEREMSDVLLFEEIAKNCNRELVYEPESSHIINSFFGYRVNVMIPDTYEEIPDYVKEVISHNKLITKDMVIADPTRYMVQNTYSTILELLDYRNVQTLYLHHSGPPLGDFDPKLKQMMRIIELCNMDYVKTYFGEDGYFSPHAETCQILAYINMVNAKLTVPAHSSNRKAMEANITLPYYHAQEKKTYVYDRENNTLKEVDYE